MFYKRSSNKLPKKEKLEDFLNPKQRHTEYEEKT